MFSLRNPLRFSGVLNLSAWVILGILSVATPATAQVKFFGQEAGYSIGQASESNVCFAAKALISDQDRSMLYTFYSTPFGQRWHVAGFEVAVPMVGNRALIRVSVDGIDALTREAETRDGDFMLPFETLEEITNFEELLALGTNLKIEIGDVDQVTLSLIDHRAALEILNDCLANL